MYTQLSSSNSKNLIILQQVNSISPQQSNFDSVKEYLLKIVALCFRYVNEKQSALYSPELWQEALNNVDIFITPTKTTSDIPNSKSKQSLFFDKFSQNLNLKSDSGIVQNQDRWNDFIEKQYEFMESALSKAGTEVSLQVIRILLKNKTQAGEKNCLVQNNFWTIKRTTLDMYSASTTCYQLTFDYKKLEYENTKKEWDELLKDIRTDEVSGYDNFYELEVLKEN
jgi:hypothetical protein